MEGADDIKNIKSLVCQFFEKMGFDLQKAEVFLEEGVLYIKVKVEEPKILIGQGGIVLNTIQKLLSKILKKQNKGEFFVDLDINEYKEKKYTYLKEMANSIADEVALSKKERELEPMPAYQRRIIHLELAKRNDVLTESIGEEPERRIIIKPK
ncbi:KH domain-containing protein [bacterium]|nr:KH domain-containing protein [bacterium]